MAVTIGTTVRCCLNIQQALSGIAGDNAPKSTYSSNGFLEALLSGANTQGFEQVQTQAFNGKPLKSGQKPKIEIEYLKPVCDDVIDECSVDICDVVETDSDPYGYLEPTIDQCLAKKGSFTCEEFNQLCETPDERRVTRLDQAAQDIERAMNKKLTELAFAQLGKYPEGALSNVTPIDLPVIGTNASGVFAQAGAWAILKRHFRQMGDVRDPIKVGGNTIADYAEIRQASGFGSNAIGASPESVGNVFYDSTLDGVIQGLLVDTKSHLITWNPGAFQNLEWYQNVGCNEHFKEDYTYTTIEIRGIKYDFFLKFDNCAPMKWDWMLKKHFDLWCIPQEAYTCEDYNHKLHYNLTCGPLDCTLFETIAPVPVT